MIRLLAALMAAAAAPAMAGPCLPRDQAVAKLDRQYGEQQVGIGVGSRGSTVIELFVAESGSWTILITQADGMSCVVASGESWSQSPLRAGEAS